MRVIAAGRRSETLHEAKADGVEYGAGKEAMDWVLRGSDFVLVSTPLMDSTQNLIGERELSLLCPNAYLINPARGHIVNEKALYNALVSKSIAGAAIDTWYEYPVSSDDSPRPSEYPFWKLENVIMTPHHSGATIGTLDRRAATVAANIDRLAKGQPLVNVISGFGAE
jgi:phosphoglycerate dehydrogenase-like enzyme